MGKYIGKIFIPIMALLLFLPSFALPAEFPDFGVLTEGGVSLKPGDMRVGRVELHPGLAFESRYESNAFQEADRDFTNGTLEGRTDDFIFTIKPSMGIELQRAPGEVFGFNIDYEGRDENWLNEGETQNFFNHKIGAGINLGGPGGRGDVTIGGDWNKQAGGASRDFNSNIGNRQTSISYGGFVDLVYSLSKNFKLTLRADARDSKYQGSKTQNVDEYNLGGSIFWQATKPAAFGIKVNHRIRRYELQPPPLTNDNSDGDQVYLALRWEPTAFISGELAVGFDTKRFENFKGDDSQNLIYQLDMTYRPVKRTGITLVASREVIDSTFGTIQSYILSSIRLDVNQKLGKKLSAFIDLSHENLDYRRSSTDTIGAGDVKTRIDNTVSGATGLKYQIQKWLEARANYKYEANFSNFHDKDFKNHVGLLEIAAKY